MSNKLKEKDIKNLTYYFFNDLININSVYSNSSKNEGIYEKMVYIKRWHIYNN